MATPTEVELVGAMREIIKGADLDNITFKIVLDVLTQKYGDLTEKKAFLKAQLPIIVNETVEEEDVEAELSNVKEEAVSNNKEKSSTPATPTANIKAEKKVTKEKKVEPKKEVVPDEESEDSEEEDDEDKEEAIKPEELVGDLAKENIEVQKLLLESIKYGTRPTRTTRSTSNRRTEKKKTPPKRKSSGEGDESTKKKRPKVNKPKILSPGLADALGEASLTRPEVVKRLHTYIKEHSLQDPKNGRNIIFDDKLQQVFRKKTTNYFKMNTLLSQHLFDPGELVE